MLNIQDLHWIKQAYLFSLVASFVFLAILEGGSQGLPSRRFRHILRNLGLFVLVIAIADGLILGLTFQTPFRLLDSDGLLTPLELPPVALFVVGFVLMDFFGYWLHRASHHWQWLWQLHSVHHSDQELDASTGLRNHPVEVSLSVTLTVLICLSTGLPMWTEGARAIIVNPWCLLQHARISRIDWLERKLGWLLATPDIHKIHHGTQAPQINANYGVMFSFWDRLFGTYLDPSIYRVQFHGLNDLAAERWQTLSGMMLTPLRTNWLKAPAKSTR